MDDGRARSGLCFCLLALALPAVAQWRTGYFMQREAGAQTAATIPWSKYTHVIHYALQPAFNNGVCTLDSSNGQLTAANIKEFVEAAHAVGVKAIIGIMEDASHQAITSCTSPGSIVEFTTRIADFAARNQYDGVDIAWETGVSAPQYEDLIRRMRTAMPSASLSVRVRMDQRYSTAAVQDDLDQINIIAYDLDSTDLSGAPLTHAWYNSATLQGTNTQDLAIDVLWRDFVSAGNAANKLGIGVPFYGRLKQACLDSSHIIGLSDPNQTWLGDVSKQIIPYRDFVNSAYWNSGTRIWDDLRQSQYIRYQGGDCSTDAFIPFTGPEQLQAVVDQIKKASLGGIVTFGLPYEYMPAQVGDARYPLSAALYAALVILPGPQSSPASLIDMFAPRAARPSPFVQDTCVRAKITNGSSPLLAEAGLASTLLGSPSATAQTFTYYVDSTNGSDSNLGTQSAPWKTIAKVNAAKLLPGQSVGFRRGGVWRESLQITRSGGMGNPIIFGAFGTGANPIINGANLVAASWKAASADHTYKIALATQPYVVIFDGTTLGTPKDNIDALAANNDWCWTKGILYVSSTAQPATRTIEAGTRLAAINASNQSFITITGLTIRGTNGRSMCIRGGSNWTIHHNVIELTSSGSNPDGSGALSAGNVANISITNNIVKNTWNDGIYLWYPTNALVSGNTLITNDGPFSDNIQISGGTNSLVIGNIADQRSTTLSPKGNIILMLGSSNTVLGNICLGGLYAISSDESNLVVTHNYSSQHTAAHSYSFGMIGSPVNQHWAYNISNQEHVGFYGHEGPYTAMRLFNNVIYDATAIGIEIDDTAGSFSGELKNNIVYGPNTPILLNINVPGIVISDYNILGPDKPSGIYYHWSHYNTLVAYSTAQSQDRHSRPSDPLFVDAPAGDFSLSAFSPAIDSGVTLGPAFALGIAPGSTWPLATPGLDQNAYGAKWEMGAYVYVPLPAK